MLVPVPRFERLAAFNKEQLSICDRDAERDHYRKNATIAELFKADQAALLDLPSVPLDVSTYITVRTNGYGRLYLQNGLHEYSVSPKFAKCKVLVKVTAMEVIPLDENHREIVRHERCYGDHRQQRMQWLPYLTQLSRSPGALKYSGIYAMLPESVQQFLERCNKGEKGKVLQAIATLTEKNGFESAVETVNDALAYDATDTDSLLNLHRRIHGNVVELTPIRLAGNIPDLKRINPNLTAYDDKLGKAGG
ncbi:Integrase catalytic domain-containing protein [Paenibacillus alkaliterrae]